MVMPENRLAKVSAGARAEARPPAPRAVRGGGNGNAVGIEDEQKTHHVHPDIHHRSQDGHGGRPFLTFGQPGFQISRNEMGGEQSHRKDHQAVEVLVQDMPNEFGQIQDVFGQLDAQLHPQKHRQEPEGPSPGFFAAPGVFGQKVDQPSEYIMKDQDPQDIEQDKGYKMDMRAPVLEFFHQQVPGKISAKTIPPLQFIEQVIIVHLEG